MAPSVAVIGAGPAGLAAVKSLKEEDFEVTAFERRSDVGGLWTFDESPSVTSTTLQTRSQVSKYTSCMSDFPFPDDYPAIITAPMWSEYYKLYARHFNLYEHIVFGVTVEAVTRDAPKNKWLVQLAGEGEPRVFDKVILAVGTDTKARYQHIENLDTFAGTYIHGQAYKRSDDFKGKNVVIMGMGNSACDAAVELQDSASKVYLSHRRSGSIVPRFNKEGGVLDDTLTWKFSRLGHFLDYHFPKAYVQLVNSVFTSMAKAAWGTAEPEGFEGPPSAGLGVAGIVVNDFLVPAVRKGKIHPVPGIKGIVGPKSVELTNGTVLEDIDVIISCTGYAPYFSLVPEVHMSDPPAGLRGSEGSSSNSSQGSQGDANANATKKESQSGRPLPPLADLYQGTFHPELADSLACLNYVVAPENAATFRELASMAIAQVWAGKSTLPSTAEMKAHVTRHQAWVWARMKAFPDTHAGTERSYIWYPFMHAMAGTGCYERLGWGTGAWRFWWEDRELYDLVAGGVYSPHILRVFATGKRKHWDGAREAIVRINAVRNQERKERKEELKKKAVEAK